MNILYCITPDNGRDKLYVIAKSTVEALKIVKESAKNEEIHSFKIDGLVVVSKILQKFPEN